MTEYKQGKILEVTEITAGSELLIPHMEGELVLHLFDTNAFDDAGGEVQIEGELYTYLSKDDDLDTLTLASGLMTDLAEDVEVLVHPSSVIKEALIQIDQEDPVEARVPHNLVGLLEVGVREGEAQESALVLLDGDEWAIQDLIGQTYSLHGGYIPGGTLPDPTIPTEPPGSSPEITDISGTPSALVVAVENVEPGSWVNYYISTTQNFTEGPATLYVSTRSTVVVITSLPDGSPLKPEVMYYVKVLAENAVGAAPVLSEEKTGELDLEAVATLIAERLVAGFILAGRIQVGQAYIDAELGIVIPQPDGGEIRLPIDGSSATITANLIARSLTVEDQWSFFGAGRVGGILTIQNKISNPTRPPVISENLPSWAMDGASSGGNTGYFHSNLARHDTTTYARIQDNTWGAVISLFDSRTVAEGSPNADFNEMTSSSASASWVNNTRFAGGFTRIPGGDYYIMVRDYDRGGDTYIYRVNPTTFALVSELRIGGSSLFANRPNLTNDGTNLLMVWNPVARTVSLRTYKPDLSGTVNADRNLITVDKAYAIVAATWGPTGDDAVGRLTLFFALANDIQCRVFRTDTWARVPTEEFEDAGPGHIRGLLYDGQLGRLVSYSVNNYFTRYSKLTKSTPVEAKYTWYDGEPAGGTHESAASPSAGLIIRARRYLRVETPPPPDLINTDPLLTDKANRIGVYIGQNFGSPRLQIYWPVGTRAGLWEAFTTSGVTHPTVTNFDTAASSQGRIRSAAGSIDGRPLIDLMGDGSGRTGPLVWNDQGKVVPETITVNFSGPVTGTMTLTRGGGVVIARGSCSRTSWTGGTGFVTIGTIPEGWRPISPFPTAGYAASNGVFYQYQFYADGTIQVRQASEHAAAMYTNETWVSA